MTIRKRILITFAWIVAGIVVSGTVTVFFLQDVPRRQWNARAETAGGFAGLVISAGCGAIWLPWAAQVGKKKRAEREKRTSERRAK